MEYLKKNILNSLNSKLNPEEEAIQTLGNRLQHATLSADRRSAVLGLKSFSRQFRESVVEYGLRPLLQALEKDSENISTVKAVMETLIILFIRGGNEDDEALGWISNQSRVQNGKYPSPTLMKDLETDQFSMWIADEVISCDDYIKAMVETLHSSQDFHVRLYTLQFLEALVATRGSRTKECLINIPLAVSTIVSLLNDPNDPVRNEAILLLMALVRDNFNIQKLVAFENTFDRLFEIIEEEGGIRGSILVQDCLTLLTNLLMYNASNQKFFLETDCVPKLASLLAENIDSVEGSTDGGSSFADAPIVWTEQRLQNMTIALEICKSFVDQDNQEKEKNQDRLYQAGIFFSILRLTFSQSTEIPIRKTALEITGDLIASNKDLQYEFSRIDVPYIDPTLPIQVQRYDKPIPAPLALLNWCLLSNSVHTFEIRLSSVYCLQCLFVDNIEAKTAFLTDQIKANQDPNYYNVIDNLIINDKSEDEKKETLIELEHENLAVTPYANIFSTLTNFDFEVKLNPYRVWFASIILIYLFDDSPENKEAAQKVTIGNPEDGEEVMTSIQAISEILTTSLENSDPRIAIGLLILLTLWLFEDFGAVNDFLKDSAIIKTLLGFLSKNSSESSTLVHGMSAILIGIVYEFSTKSSPIPRSELYSIITKALGADNYALKVKQFRECDEFKHFTDPITSSFDKDSTGLPKVYFIESYLDLVKDNFPRIRKALSRDPLVEPQLRISYEAFEELEAKYASLNLELIKLKEISEKNETHLKMKLLEAEKELENSSNLLQHSNSYLEKIRQLETILTSNIEILTKELKIMEEEKIKYEQSSFKLGKELQMKSKSSKSEKDLLAQLKTRLKDVEAEKLKAEEGINKMSRELFQLTKQQKESSITIATLEKRIGSMEAGKLKLAKNYDIQIEDLKRTTDNYKAKVKILEAQLKESSDDRDRKAFKMREFQERLIEAESNKSNLLDKLRTAATLVQHLRKANPDLKEDKLLIQAAIIQSQEESKTARELENDILQHRERISELEFSINQMKTKSTEVENNLRRELSALSEELSKQKQVERGLRDEIDRLFLELEGKESQIIKEQGSFSQQSQLLEKEKSELHQKLSNLSSKCDEEKIVLETAQQTLKKDATEAAERELVLKNELKVKSDELIELQNRHIEELKLSSSLQKQLQEQIAKFDELVKKCALEKEEFTQENHQLLSEIEDRKLQLEILLKESKEITSGLELKVNQLIREGEKSSEENDMQKEREAQLRLQVQEKEKEIHQLQEQIENSINSEEKFALELETRVAEINDDKLKLIDELKSQIDKLTSENCELEKLVLSHEERAASLSKEIHTLTDLIEAETKNLKFLALELNRSSKLLEEYKEEIREKNKTIENQALIIRENLEDQKLREKLANDLETESQKKNLALQIDVEKLKDSKATLEVKLNNYEEKKREMDAQLSKFEKYNMLLELKLEEANSCKQKLKSELKDKERRIDELEVSVKTANDIIGQEELLPRAASFDHDSSTKEALTREVNTKISELVAKDQLIRDIKRKLEDSTYALEELTEKNENLNIEKKELTEEVKKILKELKSSQKKSSNLEKQLAKISGGMKNQIEPDQDVKNEITQLEESIKANEESYRIALADLNKSNDSKLDALKSEVDILKDQMLSLKEERDALAEVNEKARFSETKLQSTILNLETKLRLMEEDLDEKTEVIQIKEQQLNDLLSSIESGDKKLHESKTDHKEEEIEINNVSEDLLNRIETSQKALIEKKEELDDALCRIASFEDALDHKNESLANAHETLNSKKREITDLENKIQKREAEIVELKEFLNQGQVDQNESSRAFTAGKEKLEVSCAEISPLRGSLKRKGEEISSLLQERKEWINEFIKEPEGIERHAESKQKLQEDLDKYLDRIANLEEKVSESAEMVLALQKEKDIAQDLAIESKRQLQELQSQMGQLSPNVEPQNEATVVDGGEAERLKLELQGSLDNLRATEKRKLDLEATMRDVNEGTSMSEELNTRLEKLKEQLSESQKKLEEEELMRLQVESRTRTLLNEQTQKIQDLGKELAAKNKLEEDFEDLMLLWEEQEKRISVYEQKLRENNNFLSSDKDEVAI